MLGLFIIFATMGCTILIMGIFYKKETIVIGWALILIGAVVGLVMITGSVYQIVHGCSVLDPHLRYTLIVVSAILYFVGGFIGLTKDKRWLMVATLGVILFLATANLKPAPTIISTSSLFASAQKGWVVEEKNGSLWIIRWINGPVNKEWSVIGMVKMGEMQQQRISYLQEVVKGVYPPSDSLRLKIASRY